MSDHWNSIANLLKTPSLGPTAKKPDGPAKPPKAVLPIESVAESAPVPAMEAQKPKLEQSRLRSSWDAVATFFGVAAPELSTEPELKPSDATNALSSQNSAKASIVGNKKAKPSMWGESADQASEPGEPAKPAPRIAEVAQASREPESPRRGTESQDRGRSKDREREPRGDGAERTESRAPRHRSEENSPSAAPERRSERQQPRRGRQADVRAEAGFGVPAELESDDVIASFDNENLDQNAVPRIDSDRKPRGRDVRGADEVRSERSPRPERESRPERAPRPERAIKPVRNEGADLTIGDRNERPTRLEGDPRAERPDSPQRSGRSERGERPSRQDRPERAPRPEGSERGPRLERPVRADVTDRAERPERSERPERGPRPERADRPVRTDEPRSDGPRGDRSASRDRPARTERPGSTRGERGTSRDANSDRLPRDSNAPVAKKPSGFGAGIQDDDDFGFVDDLHEIEHEFEPVEDVADSDSDIELSRDSTEREGRPRRRRGRGRRSESRSTEGAEGPSSGRDPIEDRDLEDDDSSEFISRNSRIPSWQDTIGTLVAVNMENHQRNQSSNRPPRGRGPRRDR